MGPRAWAAIGNIYKIDAAFILLGCAVFGYRAIQLSQLGASSEYVTLLVVVTVLSFGLAILFWNIKGPLIRGNLIARILFGGWVLLGVIASLGSALLFIGIVYLFTGEPASYEVYGRGKAPKPRFKAPAHWRETGQIGPSGATFYVDTVGGDTAGVLNSYTPVQVTDKRDGFAHVVAATGERGWIDMRTLAEGV